MNIYEMAVNIPMYHITTLSRPSIIYIWIYIINIIYIIYIIYILYVHMDTQIEILVCNHQATLVVSSFAA
jgi:hypothetical protein